MAMPFALVTQSTTDNGSSEWKVEEEYGLLELAWESPNQVCKWRSKQVDEEEKLRMKLLNIADAGAFKQVGS